MAELSPSRVDSEVRYSTQTRLLHTLEQLLAIDATEVGLALDEATDLLVPALRSEKIDVFLYLPESDSLVARGTSHTPMGDRQHALGLDHLPVSNGGRTVGVYTSGKPYFSNAVADDKGVLKGIRESLEVRSMIVAPLLVNGEKRGVLAACSALPGHYTEGDLNFLSAVSNW